jgi:hypothetical protein
MVELPVKERLLKGAKVLGDLWYRGVRCVDGWMILCEDMNPAKQALCNCDQKTKFCSARDHWVKLAHQSGRRIEQTEFGLLETMTGAEWEASGRLVTFDLGEQGIVPVGPVGHPKAKINIRSMVKMDPETIGPMLTVLATFPGSEVESVQDPAVPAPLSDEPGSGIVVETGKEGIGVE